MRINYNAAMPNIRSVFYSDGTFYDKLWRPIFTPINNVEYHSFIRRVVNLEKELGRRLNRHELEMCTEEDQELDGLE